VLTEELVEKCEIEKLKLVRLWLIVVWVTFIILIIRSTFIGPQYNIYLFYVGWFLNISILILLLFTLKNIKVCYVIIVVTQVRISFTYFLNGVLEEDIRALCFFMIFQTLTSVMNCAILTSLYDKHKIKINLCNIIVINVGLINLLYGFENFDLDAFMKISSGVVTFTLIPVFSYVNRSMTNLSVDLQIQANKT
jgi:hypothetical protein